MSFGDPIAASGSGRSALSTENFAELRKIAMDLVGLHLRDNQAQMLASRLVSRIRALGLQSIDQYLELIRDSGSEEVHHFVGAVTTHVTRFFREGHHFEYLKKVAVPDMMQRHRVQRRIRMWSAGCSTGEEPYTLAVSVLEALPPESSWDVKILATDVDPACVEKGKRGVYDPAIASDLGPDRLKWFDKSKDELRVVSRLREMVVFKRLNLMEKWPMSGPLDVIFCRNVVIYFNQETQARIFNRFAELMEPGGKLFIGHSESLYGLCDRFKLVERSIYERV